MSSATQLEASKASRSDRPAKRARIQSDSVADTDDRTNNNNEGSQGMEEVDDLSEEEIDLTAATEAVKASDLYLDTVSDYPPRLGCNSLLNVPLDQSGSS